MGKNVVKSFAVWVFCLVLLSVVLILMSSVSICDVMLTLGKLGKYVTTTRHVVDSMNG